MTTFTLNSGYSIPAVAIGAGFGWKYHPGEFKSETDGQVQGLITAIQAGYRHIDTAAHYESEWQVGEAVRKSGVPRQDIFVTTKLWSDRHNDVRAAFEESMEQLGLEYVDAYLIHLPQALKRGSLTERDSDATLEKTWRQMEALLDTGRVRSIGVSNFSIKTLTELLERAKVVPAINQVEGHPFLPQHDLLKFCKKRGIHLTVYSPMGKFNSPMLKDPRLVQIAQDLGVSVGKVILSWAVQRGTSAAVKSSNAQRQKENLVQIKLEDEHMKIIDTLPVQHGRVNAEAWNQETQTSFGWTLEDLGWENTPFALDRMTL